MRGVKFVKEKYRGFIMGVVSTILVLTLSVSVFALSGTMSLSATYKNIKIKVNGTTVVPKDANGKVVEPFVSDGTTYLPVRAIATALGQNVTWDGSTNTVSITSSSNGNSNSSNSSVGYSFNLTPGTYTVGKSFDAGTYKIEVISGCGNVSTDDYSLYQIFAASGTMLSSTGIKTYNNAVLKRGAVLELFAYEGNFTVRMTRTA